MGKDFYSKNKTKTLLIGMGLGLTGKAYVSHKDKAQGSIPSLQKNRLMSPERWLSAVDEGW